jgi:hypothetical protein
MSRLAELQILCSEYSFDDVVLFSGLLHKATEVFPGVDREISKIYDITLDAVRLWMDGTICPDRRTQSDIVIYIHNKAQDYREAEEIGVSPIEDMVVYNSWSPVNHITQKVPFFKPYLSQAKSVWNSLKALLYLGDVSIENLDKLIDEAKRDRETIFQAQLTRKIASCNKLIVKSVRKNSPSVAFRVGTKSVKNVRIANAIRDYLKVAGFMRVETMFEINLSSDGDVYVEINLQ